jgi:hypothetical protein
VAVIIVSLSEVYSFGNIHNADVDSHWVYVF